MLELSRTTGYALLALAHLEVNRDRWVLAKEIVQHTGVAAPYLSSVLHRLARAGLVLAKRGYRGGFRLARPGRQIALLEIVEAVEGRPREQRCLLGLPRCSDQIACPLHALWKKTRARLEARFARMTLADLAVTASPRSVKVKRPRRRTASTW